MNKKRLNIKEFSQELGVSTATVSRAFSTKGRISKETRYYIHQKAIELGYRANANARNLILQKSDSIGFFYPSLIKEEPDYFISEIMLGINEAVLDMEMRLHIYPFSVSGDNLSETYKTLILDGALDGVIIHGGTKEANDLISIAEKGDVPYIAISDIEKPTKGYVGFDTAEVTRRVGSYFLDSGRKHPAFISGLQDQRKLKGFKKGLDKLSKKLQIDNGGSTFQDGFDAFERVIKQNSEIDCVFCANDVIAIGFMSAAIEKGISIPEELSVVGCDDIKFAKYNSPPLTTIRIPKYKLGEKAVTKLIEIIENKSKVKASCLLSCELIERKSS